MNVKILCFHAIFMENAKVLSHRSNIELIQGKYTPTDGDVLIVFGIHQQPHVFLRLLQDFQKIILVVIQSEQLFSPAFENKYYISLMRHKRCYVYDWSSYNSTKLKSVYNIQPISLYSFDFYGKEPHLELKDRPIDIFFCGGKTPRRESIINDLKEKYSNYNFFIDFAYSLTDQNKMVSILKKSKIVLNISYYDDAALEVHRIVQSKAAGCEVLSEYSSCDDLNNVYADFIHFTRNFVKSLENLGYFLQNPKKSHQEWNTRVNHFTLRENVEKLEKILEIQEKI